MVFREKNRNKHQDREGTATVGGGGGGRRGGEGAWRQSSVHQSVIHPSLALPSLPLPGSSHLVPRSVLLSDCDPWTPATVPCQALSVRSPVCLSAPAWPLLFPLCCGLLKCPSLPLATLSPGWRVCVSMWLWLDLSAGGLSSSTSHVHLPADFIKHPPSFPSSRLSCCPLGVRALVCVYLPRNLSKSSFLF